MSPTRRSVALAGGALWRVGERQERCPPGVLGAVWATPCRALDTYPGSNASVDRPASEVIRVLGSLLDVTETALALVSDTDVDRYIATRIASSESLVLGPRSASWSDATAGELLQVLGGLADVLEGLGPGDVLRVVGPERLLVGLETGTYHLVRPLKP